MIKILVAIPRVDRPIPDKLQSYLKQTKFDVEFTDCLKQELARTTLVTKMLDGGYEGIAFIDSDMSPNIDLDLMFEKFYHLELPVVSALTSSRGRLHQLLLFKKNPTISYPVIDENMYAKDSIVQVYAIGFGACLIRREVFEQLELPWFKTQWDYVIPETNEIKTVGSVGMGADFYFSMECNKHNIPMHIDCGSIVHHMEMHSQSSYYKQEFPWVETIQHRNI